MDILVLIGSFTVVCLMGMPVAYALGIASILGALYTGIPLEAVMLKVAGGMSGFSLLAIPFFILTGAIMAVGGMAERLINLAKVFVGAIRGGMALVNIVASTMFGCISGSSVADTAAVGGVMIPQMIKMGYPRLFAVNVTISGSLQPLLVPPSHNMSGAFRADRPASSAPKLTPEARSASDPCVQATKRINLPHRGNDMSKNTLTHAGPGKFEGETDK